MKENKKYIAKPFVKWVGGKTQLLHEIEQLLPEDLNKRNNLTYVEPFVGGGATLFWILQKFPNISKAIINDINPHLITTYNTIKNNPYELIKMLSIIQNEYIPLNEDERKSFYIDKRYQFNYCKLSEIENSALFIFLNRTCFNGLYRVNSKGLFNVPHGKYLNPKICDEKTIIADHLILQKVEIICGDFAETLKYSSPNTLFYFDPPYKPLNSTSSFNSYSKENFNDAEQIRLRDFCLKLTQNKSKFILSNSDLKSHNPNDDFFDEIYSPFDIQRVLAYRMVNANASKRGKLTELMISNIN